MGQPPGSPALSARAVGPSGDPLPPRLPVRPAPLGALSYAPSIQRGGSRRCPTPPRRHGGAGVTEASYTPWVEGPTKPSPVDERFPVALLFALRTLAGCCSWLCARCARSQIELAPASRNHGLFDPHVGGRGRLLRCPTHLPSSGAVKGGWRIAACAPPVEGAGVSAAGMAPAPMFSLSYSPSVERGGRRCAWPPTPFVDLLPSCIFPGRAPWALRGVYVI